MNILVYANCQKNQLMNGLGALLMGRAQVTGIDVNAAKATQELKELADGGKGARFDLVVSNHGVDDLLPYFDRQKIVQVPSIHFGGFHPDVVYFSAVNAPSRPLLIKNNPTMSAIALWGYTHGLPAAKTLSLYREDVFEALGYMDYFDVCCHAILENYAQHDIDVRHIERFLASRKVFMFGPLHPKFSVTLALCVGICEKIGVKPGYTFDQVDKILPDPLVLEYAWGCFPPLADRLGVPGSWFIRYLGEVFPSPKHYLPMVYEFLKRFPPGSIGFYDRDKTRFDEFHKIDDVLGRFA